MKVKTTDVVRALPRTDASRTARLTPARDIPVAERCVLWGRAAGRCEFPGCNLRLWRSPVTNEPVNIAQAAHIYSFSEQGPRGHEGINPADLNTAANLLLVCHACHRKIDHHLDGGRYTVEHLRTAKHTHEARIELVTGIDPGRTSHVLHYGAPVGDFAKPLSFNLTAPAMFPNRYPADDRAIDLQMMNSSWRDHDNGFWHTELQHLRKQFERRVKPLVDSGELQHASVFGFAPQPLLIALGTLLSDITSVDTYQLRREPTGWAFNNDVPDIEYIVETPADPHGAPALVISLSATVTPDRIRAVLGDHAAVWQVTIKNPHNDFLQSRRHLQALRQTLRPLLDRIKAVHGQTTPLHIFPAMPVSAAIELGRVRMPKADMPWHIYDQHNARGGFAPALSILTERKP